MRKIASAAAVAVLGATLLAAPAGAADPMVIANSASFVIEPVAGGSLVSVFTDHVVSLENTAESYNPWVTRGPDGLHVTATCWDSEDIIQLPILYVGPAGPGDQINLYLPNNVLPEPWGTCYLRGHSLITIYPDTGRGAPFSKDIIVVDSHPGIFAVGDVPSGTLTDGATGESLSLTDCVARLPAEANVCRPRTNGMPAKMDFLLTGAERFQCGPCTFSALIVELAPVSTGSYSRQTLTLVESFSLGIERATLVLSNDIGAGEYRLRVRFDGQPLIPPARTVEFGQPT